MASKGPAKSKLTDNDVLMQRLLNKDYVKDNYEIKGKTGVWKEGIDRDAVCNQIIDEINTMSRMDAREFAKGITNPAHQKLVYRCLARQMKMSEECSGRDLDTAFAAMKVTDDDIINAANMMAGGGKPYQVGGAFGLDLAVALLLRMTNMPKMNAAVIDAVLKTPAAFNQILGWANGIEVPGLARMSDCLKSFIGIGAGQSYYETLTNQIAGIYYRGAEAADAGTTAVKAAFVDWLVANPADAIGFTAVAMRYPGSIINITGYVISSASAFISSTAVGATTFAATFARDLWASDAGVMVCMLLYLYEKHRTQFDAIIGTITAQAKGLFIAGINGLGAIEDVIIGNITDRAIIGQLADLRTHLQKFKSDLAKTETAIMQQDTLTLIAEVASKTSKLNFEAKQAEIDADKIAILTGELNAALAALDAANLTRAAALTGKAAATSAYTASKLTATMGPTTGAMAIPGGKSRSRKLHKKVSMSNRPKKSVHSRKAKVAKRSNKKH
jgi:hypothetical protein